MTKEERKARRQKNRERRQARRELRKSKFQDFLIKVQEAPELPEETPNYQERFNEYWPAAKAALEYIALSKITGKATDAKIEDVIRLGDDVANGNFDTQFREKLAEIWKVVRVALIAVVVFITKDDVDEKIDKIIEIGDWLSGLF